MGPNGPFFELIFLWVPMVPSLHKGVLVITQGCTTNSEQVLWTGLID